MGDEVSGHDRYAAVSDDSQSPPSNPVPAQVPAPNPQASLDRQYDEILKRIRDRDPLARRFVREKALLDAKIKELNHQKRIVQVAAREHDRHLKKKAADQLREIAGVKVVAGMSAQSETRAQFKARLQRMQEKI